MNRQDLVSRFKSLSALLLSSGLYVVCLYQLFQLDFQATLFMRSLHSPFLGRLGTIGDWLGDGLTLVILCVGLWGIGYLWKKQAFQQAGIDGVVAYALAGIAAQIFKHLIGRPRPRLAHQGVLEYGPSWQAGFEAFPSGHAAASLAVAAVLARYFPKGMWLWYGAAFFVGVSRFVRGVHFPTDVVGGALLGFLIGYVWARPLREWRSNVLQAVPRALPFVIGGCALFWSAFRDPMNHALGTGMFWTGLLLFALGLGTRWIITMGIWRGKSQAMVPRMAYANALIVIGMAVSTQWVWVVMVTLLACGVWWLMDQLDNKPIEHPRVLHEVGLTGLLVMIVATIQGVHGFVPMG